MNKPGGSAPAGRPSPGAAPPADATSVDLEIMAEAVALARKGTRTQDASPIGCVLILNSAVVAQGHNEVGLRHDPTARAEIVAIRRACEALGRSDLRGVTLYSTLQPCGMCTIACIWSDIRCIVYGVGRRDVHRMYFEDRHPDTMNFIHDAYRDDFEIIGGVRRDEVSAPYWRPGDDPPIEEQGNI